MINENDKSKDQVWIGEQQGDIAYTVCDVDLIDLPNLSDHKSPVVDLIFGVDVEPEEMELIGNKPPWLIP